MTATARAEARTVDWRLWVPGIVTPIACFVVDYLAGEHVLRLAPAALLALAAVGIASLAISRSRRQTAVGLAAVGPLWVVGGLTILLGLVLAVFSGFGLLLSLLLALRKPDALVFSAWALLGLTPLWTGITYLREASALTIDQAARHGGLKTALLGFAGAATAVSLVTAAGLLDARIVATRLAALDRHAPETWQAGLQSLNTYPLCLRNRCRQLACLSLYDQFRQDPTMAFVVQADFPTQIDSAFKQVYGVSVSEACRGPLID